MQSVIKVFFFAATLLVAAFFANYFDLIELPWLDINSVPKYSEDAVRTDHTLKKVFEDQQ